MKTPKFKTIKINAYRPGKAEIGRIKNIIKLSANESALGISPKAKKVLSNKDLNISKYPDSKCKNLRKQICKVFKCDFKKIICGSGSDEIIQILCQLYLNPKDEVLLPCPYWVSYSEIIKLAEGVPVEIPSSVEKNFKITQPGIK